jgi:hypothetical protein
MVPSPELTGGVPSLESPTTIYGPEAPAPIPAPDAPLKWGEPQAERGLHPSLETPPRVDAHLSIQIEICRVNSLPYMIYIPCEKDRT